MFYWKEYSTTSIIETTEADKFKLRVVIHPDLIQVKINETIEFKCIVYDGNKTTRVFWTKDNPKQVTYSKVFLQIKHNLIYI